MNPAAIIALVILGFLFLEAFNVMFLGVSISRFSTEFRG